MSYVIKAYRGSEPVYFSKLHTRVETTYIPDFTPDVKEALSFDIAGAASRVLDDILKYKPELKAYVAMTGVRGPDGYVPLENTVKAMLSDDFRKRLWAEYEQLNTRRHQLKMYRKEQCNNGLEPRKLQMLTDQINHMQNYMLDILDRCRVLRIDLEEVEKEIG